MIKKMNVKKRNLFFIFALIIIAFCAVILLLPKKIATVGAITSTENYDVYTDSDYLKNNTTKTIFDYCSGDNKLYATKSKLEKDSVANNKAHLINAGDDDVIEIVPRQLFGTVNKTLHIGKEYGFFINTESKENYFTSTVLVFDIDLNTNLNANKDAIILTVKPIFQYNYIYLSSDVNYITYKNNGLSCNLDYTIHNSLVIAAPSLFQDPFLKIIKLEYETVNKYYLKDIQMSVFLYNEQELNYGDVGYNPYNDTGSFIIGYDYHFKGSKRDGDRIIGLTDETIDWAQLSTDVGLWILGWTTAVPGMGIVTQIGSAINLYKTWNKEVTSGVPIEYVIGKKPYFNVDGVGIMEVASNYKSKITQLENYKDENGNPHLVQNATIPCNIANAGGAFYGVNDFAMGRFELSNTLQTTQLNQTRLVTKLLLSVFDVETNDVVVASEKTEHKTIGDPAYKDIRVEQEQKLNLLPNGTNYFKFNAEYASDYTFNIPNANGIMVKVNGAVVNGSVSLNAGEHKVEIINLTEEKIFSSLTISPNAMYAPNNNKALSINSNQTYLLKVTSLAGVKQLCTNNNNVLIEALFNSELEPYTAKGTINPGTLISHPFVEGAYYITIRNKQSSATEINFSINEPTAISFATKTNVDMNGNNYIFVKFVATKSANHIITLGNNINSSFIIYKNDINSTGVNSKNYGYYCTVGFDKNVVYYIGFKNNTNETNSVLINLLERSYEWIITDSKNNVVSTFEDRYEFGREETYTINFKINGEVPNNLEIIDTTTVSNQTKFSYYYDKNKRTIIFYADSKLGGDCVKVSAIIKDENGFDDEVTYLYLVPKISKSVTIDKIVNGENIEISLTSTKYITKVEYKLSASNFSLDAIINGSETTNKNVISISKDDIENKFKIVSPTNVYFQIIKIYYVDVFNDTYVLEQQITSGVPFNTHFGIGNGTEANPYTITNIRHFKNMDGKNYYYKLANNLNFGNGFNIVNNFNGVLDGNGAMLSYRASIHNNCGSLGLFKFNNGTLKNFHIDAGISFLNSELISINIGGICGVNYGTIQNCSVGGYIHSCIDQSRVGGIVGMNYGLVDSCFNHIGIIGGGDVGGIAGQLLTNGTIKNCTNFGELTYIYNMDNRSIGGIVGYQQSGSVISCVNHGTYSFGGVQDGDKKTKEKIVEINKKLHPRMAQIVGLCNGGITSNNSWDGTFNSGTLGVYKWTEGGLFNKKTYTNNQLEFAGNREIGVDYR